MRISYAGAVVSLSLAFGACTSKSDGTRPDDTGGAGSGSGASAGRGSGGTDAGTGGNAMGGSTSGAAGRGTGGTGGDTSTGGTGGTGGTAAAGGSANAGNGGSSDAGSSGSASSGQGGTGGGDAGTGGSGMAGEAGQGPGCSLNDEFDGSALDACWQILNGNPSTPLIEIALESGALHLSAMGSQNGVWYQGATKSLVYQEVPANAFKVTTTAHSRKASDAEALPTKDLHVGGLMVRNPSSMGGTSENYVFLMLGHSEMNNGVVHQGIEFKSTVNGCSDWLEPDFGDEHDGPDAELRICRLGAEFRHYQRVPGASSWTPAEPPSGTCSGNIVSGNTLTRSDMPETVQVGLALNFNAPSDLDVAFDAIHFELLPADATESDCTSD
jgi:hypothetical protein